MVRDNVFVGLLFMCFFVVRMFIFMVGGLCCVGCSRCVISNSRVVLLCSGLVLIVVVVLKRL